MSSTMGYRSTAQPTHKAKARWRKSAAQGRIKRARLERKLAAKHGAVKAHQPTT